jgi:eukaryotic-like serine/threonine-protein kinase
MCCITFVLTFLMLSAVADSTYFLTMEALAQSADFLTYENSSFGIKMLYPQDWHRTDFAVNAGGNGTIAEIVGPEPPAPYVNIFVYHSSGSFSLPNLINSTLNEIQAVHMSPVTGMQLKNGTTAYQANYQISTVHNTFEKLQTFTMKNGLIYVITYTATPDKYSLNLPSVKKMIDSLTLSSPVSR